MKKILISALTLVALASCSKENTTVESIDTNASVAATFTSAAITRVADNAWEAGDKIGITMLKSGTYTLADGDYESIPYTVNAAGANGTFTADNRVIYFPADGSDVDFVAYYPYSTVDEDNNVSISVADQSYEDIDFLAAIARNYSKANPTVQFANNIETETYTAFAHQLSKLIITLKAGEGIDDLAGLTTTIKGQYTTAKFNIYTGEYSAMVNEANITAITEADGSKAEALLIPTEAIAGTSIVFTLDGNDYTWDTSAIPFYQGKEFNYEITITKTGVEVTGATIGGWGDGTEVGNGTGTAE